MKMLTHILSSFALSSLICTLMFRSVWVVNMAFLLSLTINYFVDVLGHKNGRRTPLTHEVLNNLMFSLIIGLLLHKLVLLPSIPAHTATLIALITSVSSSVTHLALDMVSGGVFINMPGGVVKLRLCDRRYDDLMLNTLVLALSCLTIFAVLMTLL